MLESLFNKVAGLRSATLLKKRLWHRCFPEDFAKFSRTPFLMEHLWWLLSNAALITVRNKYVCKWEQIQIKALRFELNFSRGTSNGIVTNSAKCIYCQR